MGKGSLVIPGIAYTEHGVTIDTSLWKSETSKCLSLATQDTETLSKAQLQGPTLWHSESGIPYGH